VIIGILIFVVVADSLPRGRVSFFAAAAELPTSSIVMITNAIIITIIIIEPAVELDEGSAVVVGTSGELVVASGPLGDLSEFPAAEVTEPSRNLDDSDHHETGIHCDDDNDDDNDP